MTGRALRRLATLGMALLTACTPVPPGPETPSRAISGLPDRVLPAMRSFPGQRIETPTRSNREIGRDFMDLTFRMESGRRVPRLTRFETPVSVRVTGPAPASLTRDLRALLARLRREAGIEIFETDRPDAAITVQALPRAVLNDAVPRAACFVVPRVSTWAAFDRARRTAQVDWTTLQRRDRAAVFVPSDAAPQEIRDCLHEELAQALGPLNDLYRLPDSTFNDDNIHAVLTGFDMLILRAYYDPALANGMRRGAVAARLPGILARLNPAGQARPVQPRDNTPRDWIDDIELALSAGAAPARRRKAAQAAIRLGETKNWRDARDGFAHYAFGRLNVSHDPEVALASFRRAMQFYQGNPLTRLHAAHVAVQLAAFALSSGDAAAVERLVDGAIPVARRHENAALLATLMMFKAEALALRGRDAEAQAMRMDSLGWARYGFGADTNVRARMREIRALTPTQGP